MVRLEPVPPDRAAGYATAQTGRASSKPGCTARLYNQTRSRLSRIA